MWWWWCDDEVMMMWCVVSWKTLNTRRKNQDGALMFVTMFLYNYNYPTTTTGWGWTWTSSHQPPVHVQGWSRLNNQILLTSKIVNWTFTKRGKGSKSANNQNSFKSWSPLRVMLLDYFHFFRMIAININIILKYMLILIWKRWNLELLCWSNSSALSADNIMKQSWSLNTVRILTQSQCTIDLKSQGYKWC